MNTGKRDRDANTSSAPRGLFQQRPGIGSQKNTATSRPTTMSGSSQSAVVSKFFAKNSAAPKTAGEGGVGSGSNSSSQPTQRTSQGGGGGSRNVLTQKNSNSHIENDDETGPFYAVFKGADLGVYHSYKEAKEAGGEGSMCKKVDTRKEGEDYIKDTAQRRPSGGGGGSSGGGGGGDGACFKCGQLGHMSRQCPQQQAGGGGGGGYGGARTPGAGGGVGGVGMMFGGPSAGGGDMGGGGGYGETPDTRPRTKGPIGGQYNLPTPTVEIPERMPAPLPSSTPTREGTSVPEAESNGLAGKSADEAIVIDGDTDHEGAEEDGVPSPPEQPSTAAAGGEDDIPPPATAAAATSDPVASKDDVPATTKKEEESGTEPGGEPVYKLTADQQRIFDMVVHEGKNVFITGNAGTGKSVVVKQIIKALREKVLARQFHSADEAKSAVPDATEAAQRVAEAAIAVTASTGVAALPIGGTTLHSWSSYTLDSTFEEKTALERDELRFGRVASDRNAKKYRECQTLIIDEISMVEADVFKFIDEAAKKLRGQDAITGLKNRMSNAGNERVLNEDGELVVPTMGFLANNIGDEETEFKPFGGIQIVLVGDFLQLPPITDKVFNTKVREHLFDSMTWRLANLTEYCLTSSRVDPCSSCDDHTTTGRNVRRRRRHHYFGRNGQRWWSAKYYSWW